MSDPGAIALVATSAAVAFGAAFALRTRAPAVLSIALLAACGAAAAVGVLSLLGDVSAGEWVVATALITVLIPAHVRVVLGPFGRRTAERAPAVR